MEPFSLSSYVLRYMALFSISALMNREDTKDTVTSPHTLWISKYTALPFTAVNRLRELWLDQLHCNAHKHTHTHKDTHTKMEIQAKQTEELPLVWGLWPSSLHQRCVICFSLPTDLDVVCDFAALRIVESCGSRAMKKKLTLHSNRAVCHSVEDVLASLIILTPHH